MQNESNTTNNFNNNHDSSVRQQQDFQQQMQAIKVPKRVPSQHSFSRLSSQGRETTISPLKNERFNPIYNSKKSANCTNTNITDNKGSVLQQTNNRTNLSLPVNHQ